jgi:hypothetical protein
VLLPLPGVAPEELDPENRCEEAFAEEMLATSVSSAAICAVGPAALLAQGLDSIPCLYTGDADWPANTNLRCWHCGFSFAGRPVFIPTSSGIGPDGGYTFGVHGNFCDWPCAEAVILTTYRGYAVARKRAQELLRLLFFVFTGFRTEHIRPAPERTEQSIYGGPLTEDAYASELRSRSPLLQFRGMRPVPIGARQRPVPRQPGGGPRSVWSDCGLPPTEENAGSAPAASGGEAGLGTYSDAIAIEVLPMVPGFAPVAPPGFASLDMARTIAVLPTATQAPRAHATTLHRTRPPVVSASANFSETKPVAPKPPALVVAPATVADFAAAEAALADLLCAF